MKACHNSPEFDIGSLLTLYLYLYPAAEYGE